MAFSILAPSGPVSKAIIEDLIFQIDADLELHPHAFSRVLTVLRSTVNEVASACQNPSMLEHVIAQQRYRASAGGATCKKAFDLFIENMNAVR